MAKVSHGLQIILLLSTAACGGGGGVSSTPPPVAAPAPTPAPVPTPAPPTPTPTPAPTPTPVLAFDTNEYRRQGTLAQIRADAAYSLTIPASGAGVVVGLIDTGVDFGNVEFVGQLDARSTDLTQQMTVGTTVLNAGRGTVATRGDVQGHGTRVAGILAAAKNDLGIHGIAYGATLLSYRVDNDTAAPAPSAYTLDTGAIRNAMIAAAGTSSSANPVRVLNLSNGSSGPETSTYDPATAQYRAELPVLAGANIVTVFSAGNDGFGNPNLSNRVVIDPALAGTGIVVGSGTASGLDANSNRAGITKAFYLVAPGDRQASVGLGSTTTAVCTGTSCSTPYVSGAAAIIRGRWPAMTAAQVVQLLLTTATDLGAPGVDDEFGHGLLNIAAAFSAVGTTSAIDQRGASLNVVLDSATTVWPAAMGDAGAGGVIGYLDSYGRDFVLALDARSVRQSDQGLDLSGPLRRGRTSSVVLPGLSVVGFHGGGDGVANISPDKMSGFGGDHTSWTSTNGGYSNGIRVTAGGTGFQMSASSGMAAEQTFGFSDRGSILGQSANALALPALAQAGTALSATVPVGRFTLVGGVASVETTGIRPDVRGAALTGRADAGIVRLVGRDVALSLGVVQERDQVLGASSRGGLRLGTGAATRFARVDGRTDVGAWTLAGHFMAAETGVVGQFGGAGSVFGAVSPLWLSGWGVNARSGKVTIGLSQPLRVERGQVDWRATGGAIRLTPSGREVMASAAWAGNWLGFYVEAALVGRNDAGHVDGRKEAAGLVTLRKALH